MNGLAKGWCPGALRPMESGDGLIVRLKITGGIVPVALAREIAEWSRRWGNGQIDLTARTNLQLRGLTAENLPKLQEAIATAGLLDADPDGEAVRNVIASPLAGLDPGAVLDIRPIVASLEARLTGDKRLHALPAKFCFVVDDGGRLGLGDVRADIRFEALATSDGPIFTIFFDGGEDRRVGSCKPADVAEVAYLMSSIFLVRRERSDGKIARVRDLVAEDGIRALAGGERHGPKSRAVRAAEGEASSRLGVHAPRKSTPGAVRETPAYIGIGLPFGRIAAGDLADLANRAASHGAGELRLTPWRAILIPLPSAEAALSLAATLPTDVFVLDPSDPRRRVAACAGAPACARATTDVRGDATHLAASVPENAMLHVSGCAKGCAHPRAAAVTLVGWDGRYDLVRDGVPWDVPALAGMSAAEAARHVRDIFEGKAA